MKVLIGTKNPGKIEGAKLALSNFFKDFEIEGIKVPSNVPDQPVNEDTYNGAKNRVDNLIEYAKENSLDIDYFLAVESGICNLYGTWMIVNFAVVKDKAGYESVGIGPTFTVPNSYVKEIIETSLGEVLDKVYETKDLGKGKGGVNALTHDSISRIDITKDAFIMAMTQFVNGNVWKDTEKSNCKVKE